MIITDNEDSTQTVSFVKTQTKYYSHFITNKIKSYESLFLRETEGVFWLRCILNTQLGSQIGSTVCQKFQTHECTESHENKMCKSSQWGAFPLRFGSDLESTWNSSFISLKRRENLWLLIRKLKPSRAFLGSWHLPSQTPNPPSPLPCPSSLPTPLPTLGTAV